MKAISLLAVILVSLGLIIAAVPENTTKQYKLTAEELLGGIKVKKDMVDRGALRAHWVNGSGHIKPQALGWEPYLSKKVGFNNPYSIYAVRKDYEPKPKIEVTCLVNGKEVRLSTLSEETIKEIRNKS